MIFALMLGLSDPFDCSVAGQYNGSDNSDTGRVLRVFTYNFVTNVVKKRLEHSCMLLEILLALTFPLGKADPFA